ncbi:helix-turn-helix domain-containing protein [Desulforegula conservatrix]|uniref:helix-turn-helix domain-containing protein n=1 Tax=Desulforegula conservatrix TaxID=153026 RepID=UPI00040D38B0|nr:helix-turn-helix domain-containing protein [Desulforegula conservatrix]
MTHRLVSPESLGLALRTERKKKSLTQKAVGHQVCMEQHTISKVEKGNPGTTLNTLFRLLAALDLELVIQPCQKNEKVEGDSW